MNLRTRTLAVLTGSISLLLTHTQAADLSRANNNTSALNTTGAWAGGVVPTLNDVMLWDNTFTLPVAAANLPQLGGDMSVLGIKVTNVGGTLNAATTQVGFQNTSSGNTLTIGASGIDLSGATQALQLQSKILLGASQVWAIANANTSGNPSGFNNGEDLSFQALAAGAAFNLGGNSVTTSGVGSVTITSGYTLDNGTINVGNALFVIQGGGNRVTTVNNTVNLNVATGSTLLFQSNSGASGASLLSNATLNLNGGTVRLVSNNATLTNTVSGVVNVNSPSTLNVGNNVGGGSVLITTAGGGLIFNANLAGSAALNVTNNGSTANLLLVGGNNSAYSGTVTLGATGSTTGRVTRMTAATAGSAAATWSIASGHTLALNGVSVSLGTLNGAGTLNTSAAGTSTVSVGGGGFTGVLQNGTGTLALTKVGAGTLSLSGANTYTGATSVNAGTLITSPAQTGATTIAVADGATFGVKLAGAGTTFNAVTLTTGTATGAALSFDTGALGNPTAAVINAGTFIPTAATTLRLGGSGLTAGPQFTLLDYTGAIGGTGFGGLSLVLPFRVTGNLVDNSANTSVDAVITGTAVPAWRGTIDNKWDVDSVGDGSTGTANWSAGSGPNTYVQGASVGTDSVIFDDTVGAGPTNVNLTTTLTPVGITVSNSTVDYTFSGSGKISGATGIAKNGTRSLIIANTTANDYTGATTINSGTLQVGDGATAGAGSLGTGPVSNGGSLVLNRPDNLSIAGAMNGAGSITKNGSGTVTFTAANTSSGAINLNAGKLRFTGGGNLSGAIGGVGELESGGGTLQLSGSSANTNSGLTTVSSGRLELNKTAGVNAVGGDITISGTGQLALLAGEQIPDTATINFIGSSTDSIPTQAALETIGNAIVNSSVPGAPGGQIIMRNGFTVTGVATVNSGILGVGSGQTGTANAINITATGTTSAIVRIAGNSDASTLNVGAGGITASGGDIQVKFNTNNQDAVLNLGGDFTATGNVIFTNAGYNGPNLNVVNLTDTRTFNIAAGTTTSVSPDLGGPGGLTKIGGGTLSLEALCAAAYAGDTLISAGTLAVKGSLSVSPNITVASGATLDVSAMSGGLVLGSGQTLRGRGMVVGDIFLGSGSVLAPGESIGTLTFGGNLDLGSAITPIGSGALSFELDAPGTNDQVILSSGVLSIGSNQLEFDDFNFTPLSGFGEGDYTLFDTTMLLSGALGSNTSGSIGIYSAELQVRDSGNDLVLHVATAVPEPGTVSLLLAALGTFASMRPSRRRIVRD
jgi:autotransporter-associated beta strand protein